ncbi:MAG: helix-turn-helix domain-containing protein [Paenibacillaceae bacterium]
MKKSKKDLIIEKASELFFDKGILATSMDEIAEKVPVAKMTIYKYFHSMKAC